MSLQQNSSYNFNNLQTSDISQIDGDHIIHMNHDEILDSGFLSEVLISPYDNQKLFLEDAYVRSKKLPDSFHRNIYNFVRNSNEYGVLLLKNLPIDEQLPDTPRNSMIYPDKKGFYVSYGLLQWQKT